MFYILLVVPEHSCQILDEIEWKFLRVNSSLSELSAVSIPGNSVQLEYNIQLAIDKCCPILLIQTTPLDKHIRNKECYEIHPDLQPTLLSLKKYVSLDWKTAEYTEPQRYHNSDVFQDYRFVNDEEHYMIFGRQDINFVEIGNANVYIFYPCVNKHYLNIRYKLSITAANLSASDCIRFESGSPCVSYYSKWSLPNIFGQSRSIKAKRSMSFLSGLTSSGCHQHVMEIMCRIIFPECTAKWKLAALPCQSMCYEVMDSCESEYSNLAGLSTIAPDLPPVVLKHSFSYAICNLLPETTSCLHKNVSCGTPQEIDHGRHDHTQNSSKVTSVAHYTCNEGYYSEGNSTAVCQYSGKWSQPPQCLLKQTYKTIIILSSVFGMSVAIVVIFVVLLYKYRKDIAAVLFVKLGIQFVKEEEEDRQYDAFIAYSPEDIDFVKNELLEPLESMEPPFNICLRDRDFELGDWRSNNIIRSVQESKRTIVVLSQNFINSQWCQFEFAQAHLHLLEDQSYKLLVIALEDPKTLENMPKLIDSYIQSRTYLAREDRLFWNKLLYQMPRK